MATTGNKVKVKYVGSISSYNSLTKDADCIYFVNSASGESDLPFISIGTTKVSNLLKPADLDELRTAYELSLSLDTFIVPGILDQSAIISDSGSITFNSAVNAGDVVVVYGPGPGEEQLYLAKVDIPAQTVIQESSVSSYLDNDYNLAHYIADRIAETDFTILYGGNARLTNMN